MARQDWYMCEKCFNQGWVLHGGIPNPNWKGGCNCEGIDFLTGSHEWKKMEYEGKVLYENHETDLKNYPAEYFEIK